MLQIYRRSKCYKYFSDQKVTKFSSKSFIIHILQIIAVLSRHTFYPNNLSHQPSFPALWPLYSSPNGISKKIEYLYSYNIYVQNVFTHPKSIFLFSRFSPKIGIFITYIQKPLKHFCLRG